MAKRREEACCQVTRCVKEGRELGHRRKESEVEKKDGKGKMRRRKKKKREKQSIQNEYKGRKDVPSQWQADQYPFVQKSLGTVPRFIFVLGFFLLIVFLCNFSLGYSFHQCHRSTWLSLFFNSACSLPQRRYAGHQTCKTCTHSAIVRAPGIPLNYIKPILPLRHAHVLHEAITSFPLFCSSPVNPAHSSHLHIVGLSPCKHSIKRVKAPCVRSRVEGIPFSLIARGEVVPL